ncbi:MAG: FG-GAP-like repeat-containing protein [Ignavibacteria bacterium]|nr:choice-of-anchor D domain-containing protein [Ignavibacteria bacterium]
MKSDNFLPLFSNRKTTNPQKPKKSFIISFIITLIIYLLLTKILNGQTLVQVINLPNDNFFNYGYGLTIRDGLLWVSSSYSTGNLGAKLYAVDTLGIIRDSVIFSSSHVNSSQGLTTDGNVFYFVQRYTARCRIIRIAKNGQILDSLNWPTASSVYLGGLAYDGQIWASVYYPNSSAALYRIDINTSQVTDTIPVFGLQPQGIAVKGDTIFYVMDGFDGDPERIYAVNRFTKDTLFSFPLPETPGQRQNPRGLAWDGNYLYLLAEPVGASSGRQIFKYVIGGGSPSINIPTKFFDFGNVVLGNSGQITATIVNNGTANLVIDSLRFFYSSRFTTNLTTPAIIQPNGNLSFQIFFSPIAYGSDSSHLYIYHNDLSRPAQVIRLVGNGIYGQGVISVPPSYNFGTKRVGSTNFWWMKIENLSNQPINIFSWNTSIPDFYLEPDIFPLNLPANSFKYVRVWFNPRSSGLISDTLRIINNSTNAPEAKIFLTGTGEIQNLSLAQPLWTHTMPNHPISNTYRTIKGIRAINDITGDGKSDVIVCTENYWTAALNGNSSGGNDTLWSFNTYISNSSAGSIGSTGDYSYQKALSIASDLNGDGFNDVVIGTGGGNESVYALNGKTGQMLWKFGTDHPDSFALGDITGVDATTDFNNDGIPDVIAAASATQSGGVAGRRSVYLFNGPNGQIIWQRFVGGFTHGVTAIPDINNDGIPDVIATVGEPVYQFQALSGANGNLIWAYQVGSNTGGAKEVLVFPVPGQKPDVIAGAFWGPVYRLKGTTGLPLWTFSTGGGAPTQMKILRDVNGDGVDEVVISILAGGAVCVDGANGNTLWYKSTGNTMGVDIIPDLNGDGSDDVVFAVQNQGALIVNGSNGNELALYSFGGNTQAREVAVVPDLDNNGSKEILVGSNLGNVALLSGGVVVQASSIQVTKPNGGEIWYVNQHKLIEWTSTNVNNVKIEISTNNGSTWNLIATNIAAQSGSYEWLVTGSTSEQCLIKISSLENPNVFDISDNTFSIRTELCVNFSLNSGWNIVSVPVARTNMSKTDIFPNATSSAFAFSQSIGYYTVDTLSNGKGYWLKYPNSTQVTVCGLPIENPFANVKAGWNLIGGFENDVSVNSITTNPPDILQSYFFGYQNGYFVASTIQKGKGYWIKVSQDGKIIFNQNMGKVKSKFSTLEKILSDAGELIITDNQDRSVKLYLSDNLENDLFELPPTPPAQIFDVRFSSNRFVENVNKENYLIINSGEYPIRIKSTKLKVKVESEPNQEISQTLTPGDELVIEDKNIKLLKLSPVTIPDRTELYQNYPNPFNPVTKIKFALKEKSRVQLKLFDVIGREISTLIDEEREAGIYSFIFDAAQYKIPSGIYFYQLISGDYKSIKKMVYLK